MGFDEGQIILDSENGAYYAGQTIFGKLKFHQDKVKKFRGIYVKAKGFAHVHWTSSHTRRNGDRDETYHVDHDAHEEYFRSEQYLVGGKSGEYRLEPGDHEFAFQCHIPPHCPSSYEGTYGHIRYELKVVVDLPFKTDQKKTAQVRVIAPMDLNLNPLNREPIEYEFNESYCCFCMSSGSCETVVKLPVTGYSVGQVIPVEIGCQNKGNVEIDGIKLRIIKKTIYHANSEPGTQHEEEIIQEVKKGPVAENTNKSWTVEMPVPVMDVNNVSGCQIINITYEFKVSVVPSGCHENSDQSRSIVIGDVPLNGFQDDVTNPLQDQMPKQPITLIQTPYPTVNVSYRGPQAITTQPFGNGPYPGANPTFPGAQFPSPNQPLVVGPYPGNTPHLGTNPPYAVGNPPYPGGNPPFPSQYPSQPPPYSAGNPPYLGGNPSYPGGNPPNPGGNPPYPGGNPPYPGGNPPYQVGNPPYAGGNPPYPGGNPPYPGGNPPYPGADVPVPVLNQPPRSPMGFRSEKSENQEAAPLLPYLSNPSLPVSPFPPATAPAFDDKSSGPAPKVPETPTLLPQSPYNPAFITPQNS